MFRQRPPRTLTSPPALAAALVAVCLLPAPPARGQSSSLYRRDLPEGPLPPAMLESGSWTYLPVLPPHEVKKFDLVTVRVDVAAQMQSEGEVERRKNALYDAILQDWVLLKGLRAIKPDPQPDGDQRVRGQLTQLLRSESDLETSELLKFQIAARVADIRPNGTLVLEAHQQVRNNQEVWEYSLSGICRREDVGPGNVVLSRDIYDLKINKRERGHVRDGYKRGWFLRWFDEFHPF